MTTIVIDQAMGYMAADRRVTANDGDMVIACPTKIERIEVGGDEYLIAASGLEGPAHIFIDWFIDGDWDDPPDPIEGLEEDDDFSVLIMCKEASFVVDKFMRMTEIHHRWYAIGSGGVIAWAVLEAGCGIDKAMETAIKMDSGTGGGYDICFLDGTEEAVEG